jgi:hypothetical protein
MSQSISRKLPLQPRKFWMPNSNYMANQQDINEKMRRILVDWLLKVHGKFKLLPETLYLTINIIDRYLSYETVTRKVLQLIGVTAMHIAWKYEEIYPPEASDFVYITDNAYSKKELLETEYKILKTLNFNLTFVSAYRYLERLWTVTDNEILLSAAHKYLNLSMVEYSMIQHDPGTLAASALYLANAVEKRKIQKRSHQNSTHSLGTTQMNSKEQTLDSNISKLAQEVKLSESDIKRCALEINIIAGSHEQ